MNQLSLQLEQVLASTAKGELADPDGFFQDGMWNPLPGRKDRRPLDDRGSRFTHKLSGVVSNIPGITDVGHGQDQLDQLHIQVDIATAMLYINKKGGTHFQCFTQLAKSMELVYAEGHISHS